jgi:ribokinase
MDVISVGGATIDVFVLLHNLKDFNYDKFSNQISFPLGSKVPLDEYKLTLGGNACNVSVGLCRLGINSTLVAEIGTDELSNRIKTVLDSENVNTRFLSSNPARNDHFNIVLSYEGERTIIEEKSPETVKLNLPDSAPGLVYLTSLSGDWREIYDTAISKYPNSKFAFNPGPRQLTQREEILFLLPKIDVLFVNFQEAQKLVGDDLTDVKVLLRKLKSLGPKTAVLTDGRNGSYSIDAEGKTFGISSASDKKPVERTGAGDAYAAGFLYGYLNGKSNNECMKTAAVSADCVIEKVGAQEGLVRSDIIEETLSKFTALKAFEI